MCVSGVMGMAYTLYSKQSDLKWASLLVDNLDEAGQPVPDELVEIAGKVLHPSPPVPSHFIQ